MKVRDRLFPAFAAALDRIDLPTELSEQIALSVKMFRHGSQSASVGIEFLCKFSALEGLVCGAEQNKKKALLKDRISSLMPAPTDWQTKVVDLWELRCQASHQAKAFSTKFVQATKDVEFIFLAALVFASENVHIQSINDLWLIAKSYTVPPEVLAEPETLRGRVSRAFMPLNERWTGISTTISVAFKDPGPIEPIASSSSVEELGSRNRK